MTYTAVFLDLREAGVGAEPEAGVVEEEAEEVNLWSFPFLPLLMEGPASDGVVEEV